MVGVEIDMIVSSALEALALYERIFPVERIEVTDLPKGQNEAVFSIFGTCFHLLDESEEFGLTAPRPDDPRPMWCNVVVDDIAATHQKALDCGCAEVEPIREVPTHGVSHSLFADIFGYVWMLHQVHRDVGFDERVKAAE